jgi:VWFA-related protein
MERFNVMAFLVPCLGLSALGGSARAQDPDYRISVSLDLVELDATVRDAKGQLASELTQQDFEVYEDGVLQSIRLFRHEDLPVTVGLVVDHSGSMQKKLPDVIAAARIFVQSSSPADEMFVVNFNGRVTLGLPAAMRFSDRPDELANAISIAPAAGETALYDAIVVAQDRLRSGTHDKKVLLVISDGGDNRSTHNLPEVLTLAEQSHAILYTIGIFDDDDPDQNPNVLRHLAEATGGEAFLPRQPKDVARDCEHIARDIRHQYVLGYASSNPAANGGFRAIRVVAHSAGKGKLVVRTRSGYIPGAPVK